MSGRRGWALGLGLLGAGALVLAGIALIAPIGDAAAQPEVDAGVRRGRRGDGGVRRWRRDGGASRIRIDAGALRPRDALDAGIRPLRRDGGAPRVRRWDAGAAPAASLTDGGRRRWRRPDGAVVRRPRRRDAGPRDAGVDAPPAIDAYRPLDAYLQADAGALVVAPVDAGPRDAGIAVAVVAPAPVPALAPMPVPVTVTVVAPTPAPAPAPAAAAAPRGPPPRPSPAPESHASIESERSTTTVVPPSVVAVPVGERDGGGDEVAAVLRGLVPSTPEHRFGGTLLIGFFFVLMFAAARGLVYARSWLRPAGVLPRLAAFSQTTARALAVLALLALGAIWLPGFLHPAVPWVILAAALALGWSARELLPDLVAGATIAIERRLRVGQWVRGPGWEGEIVALGARAATLRDPQGRTTLVPNRLVLAAPALVDDARWPTVEIAVHADARHPADVVRRALLDAALLSPLTPPAPDATVARDPRDPALWRVRLRIREARHARDVEADVAERTSEILGEPPR